MSDSPHPLIGCMLGERFRVDSFIREGGMAQVFCGSQEAEPRHVAIKVMHPELACDPKIAKRFAAEARLSSQLKHPNIVQLLAVAGEGQQETLNGAPLLYYVMELLFGDDLSARIKQRGAFSHAQTVAIIIEVCRALGYAHQRGVVHRDIKPENIMLCRQPSAPLCEIVKVLDFGIAKILDTSSEVALPEEAPTNVRSVLTRVGGWVGTPAYMSPEQGRAETVDHRSDLYSVGVLLFELLTGRLPFDGETPLQILARHVHEAPPKPSSLIEIHGPLEQVVLQALAKDREQRFSTAQEFAVALEAVLADLEMPSSRRWSEIPKTEASESEPLKAEAPKPEGRAAPSQAAAQAAAPPPVGAAAAAGTAQPPTPAEMRARLRALKRTTTMAAPSAQGGQEGPLSRHPLVGRLLGDRYEVASFLREGSLAQVFTARDARSGAGVALKVVHPEVASDASFARAFLEHGQRLVQLSHPHIVSTIEVRGDQGILFVATPLLFGDDLSARVKQRGVFSFARSVEIVISVLRGLDYAEKQGILHGDLKPENVMLVRDPEKPAHEEVKVLDFGLAALLGQTSSITPPAAMSTLIRHSLVKLGNSHRTPAYAAPEFGRAEPLGSSADIYSAGVLLYELLCGRPPFSGETPLQIAARHVQEPPPSPTRFAPIGAELERVVLQMLAKRPDGRPSSAAQAADTLHALLPELRADPRSTRPSARWTGTFNAPNQVVLVDRTSDVMDSLRATLPVRTTRAAVAATQKLERPAVGLGLPVLHVVSEGAEISEVRPVHTAEVVRVRGGAAHGARDVAVEQLMAAPAVKPALAKRQPVSSRPSVPKAGDPRLIRWIGILAGMLGAALLTIAVLLYLYFGR